MSRIRRAWRAVNRRRAEPSPPSEAALDRDRVASMADEGGAAAAEVDAQAATARRTAVRARAPRGGGVALGALTLGAVLGAVVYALGRRRLARDERPAGESGTRGGTTL